MKKKYYDMTLEDKKSFLDATIEALEREQGVKWEIAREKIQSDIDNAFDDDKFLKLDPDSQIDAAYARREFGNDKPDLVDYMLWMIRFVTKSDDVEW